MVQNGFGNMTQTKGNFLHAQLKWMKAEGKLEFRVTLRLFLEKTA